MIAQFYWILLCIGVRQGNCLLCLHIQKNVHSIAFNAKKKMKYRPREFDKYRLKIVYYNCYEIFNNFAFAIPIYFGKHKYVMQCSLC